MSSLFGRVNSGTNASAGRIRKAAGKAWRFVKSKKGKMVLKCSLAYFIGSLAT